MDKAVFDAIELELNRQRNNIELIASENFVSEDVLKVQGSILTNKYAEGYSAKRYYGGCEYVDIVEDLAVSRVCELFDAKYANVQPHSGSSANMGACRALLEAGDTVLGMALDHGGHLTHGHPLSFSGIDYNFISYHVTKEEEAIDFEEVAMLARKHKPKMIIAGASAYSLEIDFKKFRDICDEVGALLMVDMAHIAGLVAAGLHQNPVPYADVVTSTTHKTLRGPRGGIILTNSEEIITKLNRTVFPGIQGGPLMHVIGAKAVAFKEALEPEFKEYQKQVIVNALALANALNAHGFRIISKTTENHLVLVETKNSAGVTGKQAEAMLDEIGITCNKNTIPYDEEKPFITSGIRLGSPAMTTRGFKEKEFEIVAQIINDALRKTRSVEELREEVSKLTSQYTLYGGM